MMTSPQNTDATKKSKKRIGREQALAVAFEKTFNDASTEEVIEAAQLSRDFEVTPYALELLDGMEKNIDKIDSLIDANTKKWTRNRMSRISISLLRLAIYEILSEGGVPIGVSINEAVELAKEYASQEDAAFINGVLGAIARTLENN